MTQPNLWDSTLKIHLLSIFGFLITAYYWNERLPEVANHHSIGLIITLISTALLSIAYEKSSKVVIGSLFLFQVAVISLSITISHNYYVTNFEIFQPYLGVKLLALTIAILAPPQRWVGWGSLSIITLAVLIQYYIWPIESRSQLGIQEPAITLCFILVAGILYLNRLSTYKLMTKEIINKEKISILQKLRSVTMGLQHLNNTPLQTIEISLELLKKKCPEGESLIQSLERSYQSLLRVNQILSSRTTLSDQKSATTIEQFQDDITEIGKYLKN